MARVEGKQIVHAEVRRKSLITEIVHKSVLIAVALSMITTGLVFVPDNGAVGSTQLSEHKARISTVTVEETSQIDVTFEASGAILPVTVSYSPSAGDGTVSIPAGGSSTISVPVGTTLTFAYSAVVTSGGTRAVLISIDHISPLTNVIDPVRVVATYKSQYYLTLNNEGPASGSQIVGGVYQVGLTGAGALYELATDSQGNAIIVWFEVTADTGHLYSMKYEPSTGWCPKVHVDTGGQLSAEIKVGFDSKGNAMAVWAESDGSVCNLFSSRWLVGASSWTDVHQVQIVTPHDIELAVAPNGDAIAVWNQYSANVWASHYVVDQGWSTPQVIQTAGAQEGEYATVAMDRQGNGIAVWAQYERYGQSTGRYYSIWANRFVVNAGWQGAQLIENDDLATAYTPKVAFDGLDNAIVVWIHQYWNPTSTHIWANRYLAIGGWQSAGPIEDAISENTFDVELSKGSDGNLGAVWVQGTFPLTSIWADRYSSQTGWQGPEQIDARGNGASGPDIAVDSDGNAMAVWQCLENDVWHIWAKRFVTGGGWQVLELIESNWYASMSPHVSAFQSGNIVSWQQADGYGNSSVWWGRYVSERGWLAGEGEGWYAADSYATFSIRPDVVRTAKYEQHLFTRWAGDSDSTQPTSTILMDGPKSVTALWKTQYYLKIESGIWGSQSMIETGDGPVSDLKVASDSNGNVVCAWLQLVGSSYEILVSRYIPGFGWESPTAVGSGYNLDDLDLATNDAGNVIVVWSTSRTWEEWDVYHWVTHYECVLWVNYFDGSAWHGAISQVQEEDYVYEIYPIDVAMGPDGSALVNYIEYDLTGERVVCVQEYDPYWDEIVNLGIEFDTIAWFSQIQVALGGIPVIIWTSGDAYYSWDTIEIWAKVGLGGTPVKIGYAIPYYESPDAAVDAAGNLLVVWNNGTARGVFANRCTVNSGTYQWGGEALIGGASKITEYPTVAMNSAGEAIVVWTQTEGGAVQPALWNIRYDPATGWGEEEPVESPSTERISFAPDVAMDDDGNALVVWQRNDDPGGTSSSRSYILANQYTNGIGWGSEHLIDNYGKVSQALQVTIDSNGNGLALWMRSDATTCNAWSSSLIYGVPWCVVMGEGWYDSGSQAEISVAPTFAEKAGVAFSFSHWSGDLSSILPIDYVSMDAPKTITVNWKVQYRLTVVSDYDTPGGSGLYDAGTYAYATLDQGLASAGTGTRYSFAVWRGDASGTGLVSNAILMNGPKTATAIWGTQYYLTVGTGGHGTVTGEGWYDPGTFATFTVSPNLVEPAWSYTTGNEIGSSPVVYDGMVYIGSADKNIYAFDADTGTWIWTFTTGGAVYCSLAEANGVIYAASTDGKLYALDAVNGNLKWWKSTGGIDWSSPIVADGIVYIGSTDGNLYAFDAASGASKWVVYAGVIESRPAVAYGRVYIGSFNGMYAFNALTGVQVWSRTGISQIWSSPAVADGIVYFGSDDHKLYALNASTGNELWSRYAGGWVESSPAVAGGRVYVGSYGHSVYAFDAATGNLLWTYATGDYVYSSPCVVGSTVYIGSGDHKVYALDASSGALLWNFTTGGFVDSSPAVSGGLIYIGSSDNKLYALTADLHYVFAGWSGDSSSMQQSAMILMLGPKTVTATWQIQTTQYPVTFAQSGLGSDASGIVVTIDGISKAWATLPCTLLVDSGAIVTYSYTTTVPGGTGKQYVLTGVAGPESQITVTGPVTVTGNYETQYLVTFEQAGIPPEATSHVTVNGVNHALPYSEWFDLGATVDFAYEDPVSGATGTQYVLTSTSHTTGFTVSGPTTVTATYKTQYLVAFAQSGLGNDASGTVVTVDGLSLTSTGLSFQKWVDSGSSVSYSYAIGVSGGVGVQYVLTDITGPTSPMTVTEPVSIIGNYMARYWLNVWDGGHGTVSGWGLYDTGSTATFSISPTIVDDGAGTRYVFVSWSYGSTSTNPTDTIVMDGPKAVTAVWKTQYLVTFDQNGIPPIVGSMVTVNTVIYHPPCSEWFDEGGTIDFAYQDPVLNYRTLYVLTSTSHTTGFTVSGPTAVTATYKTQYYLEVITPYAKPDGEGWYDAGARPYARVTEGLMSGGPGTQYVFTGWSGDATGTGLTSNAIVMDGPKTATALWNTQYLMTFDQTGLSGCDMNSGLISVNLDGVWDTLTLRDLPCEIWIRDGGSVEYSYTPLQGSASTWGDHRALDTVTGPGSPFTVTGPVSVIGNYIQKYTLWVDIHQYSGGPITWSGNGDYDPNVVATFSISPTVVYDYNDPSTRYVFVGWAEYIEVPSGVIISANPTDTIVMDGPKWLGALWRTEYLVGFSQTGLSADSSGAVVTVNGNAKAFADMPCGLWIEEGASVTYSYTTTVPAGTGKQYVLTGVTGLTSPITATGPATVTGSYKTQCQVTFSQSGLGVDATGTVLTVNGIAVTYTSLPYSTWIDLGGTVTYSYSSPVSAGTGKEYVLTGVTGPASPIGVSGPMSVVGNYKTQYYLTVVSNYDTPGGQGWYDLGSTAYATLQTGTVVITGVQYVFSGWSLNGVLDGTGLISAPVIMNGPVNAVANWVSVLSPAPPGTPPGSPGGRAGSYSYTAPSDGMWRLRLVNDGITHAIVTVVDTSVTPNGQILNQDIKFSSGGAFPKGTLYTNSVHLLAGHVYKVTITPYGAKGSIQVFDEFTPDQMSSTQDVESVGLGILGIQLLSAICLGLYILPQIGNLAKRPIPVPKTGKRRTERKLRLPCEILELK